MPIVSGFVVPKMNPTRHVGNIRLLRPVVVTVEHQEDSQAENYESKDKEEPEEKTSNDQGGRTEFNRLRQKCLHW